MTRHLCEIGGRRTNGLVNHGWKVKSSTYEGDIVALGPLRYSQAFFAGNEDEHKR